METMQRVPAAVLPASSGRSGRMMPASSHGGGAMMPLARVLRAYAIEVRYELLRTLRMPSLALPFLLMPAPIYLFFGVTLAGAEVAKQPGLANYLFSGFSVFAVMGPAIFGAGCTLALEREAGYLRLKRALPAPGGAYLVAKMVVAMVFAALAMVTLLTPAILLRTMSLTGGQLAVLTLVMILGAIPFCAIGLCVGVYASGSSAPAFGNLIYLPMLYLSGLFIPLPGALKQWVVIWPSFHLNQLALGAAGVQEFRFVAPAIAAAVLIGVTVLFGGLAVQRLARRG